MRLFLILISLAVLSGCAGSAGSSISGGGITVSGTIGDVVTAGQTRNIYIFVDTDTDKTNGSVLNQQISGSASISYSLGNLSNGNYFIYAWKDINTDGVFNSGDSFTSNISFSISGASVSLSNFNLDTVKP